MLRKITGALIGLTLLFVNMVPALAATYQTVGNNQSGYTLLILPAIIQIMYLLLGGALSKAYLIWAYNNHLWPFN